MKYLKTLVFKLNLAYLIVLFSLIGLILSTYSIATSHYYLYADADIYQESFLLNTSFQNIQDAQYAKVSNINSTIEGQSKIAFVLDNYFQKFNSPLIGYGKFFVDACKKYNAPEDCLTVAAIAKHETNLCTYKYSAEMFNCWGFGGGAEYRWRFNSFEESIDKVTEVLALQYGRRYMIDARLMERTFCGVEDPLCEGWGTRVNIIINEINDFSKAMGMGDLIALRE